MATLAPVVSERQWPGESGPLASDSAATRCSCLFWSWLALRTVGWTLLAGLTQPNAPLDLIEWLSWGREWCWGYHKHPPFPAWIAELFAQLSPGGVWGVYLAGYLSAAICFAAVWRLAREMLPPRGALVAALALEAIIFFNYDAAEFNNNVVLNACWAVAILCFHQALRTDLLRWWLGLGSAAGLALLSKYTVVFLLAPMALFLLLHPAARRAWRRPGPYLATAVALALFAPHLAWVVRHDFLTLHYGLERSAGAAHWLTHLKYPALFVLSQLGRLLPLFLVLLPLTAWRWRPRPVAAHERFDRTFLLTLVLGPVLLHLLVSLIGGLQLREIWGSPLWTFTGLLLLFTLRIDTSSSAFARARWCWVTVVVLFVGLALAKNYGEPVLLGKPKRIHFPGQELAGEVTRLWRVRYAEPFPLVAGDCWMAGNLGCYAPHRPTVYPSRDVDYLVLDPLTAPWTSDEDLRRRGGVLVWNAATLGDDLPAELRGRFPTAEVQPALVLPYACVSMAPPVRVGLAFLAPP